jgi:PqqD family protein of HPr-rel-A system
MTQPRPLWTASRLGAFQWRNWDDSETILFHTASGDTHVLSPPAAVILKELEHDSLPFEEIVKRVTISLGDAHDDSLADQVEQLLDEFDQLGLIEPVT